MTLKEKHESPKYSIFNCKVVDSIPDRKFYNSDQIRVFKEMMINADGPVEFQPSKNSNGYVVYADAITYSGMVQRIKNWNSKHEVISTKTNKPLMLKMVLREEVIYLQWVYRDTQLPE